MATTVPITTASQRTRNGMLIATAAMTVVHDEANAYDAVVPPIVQTSLFTFSSYAEMEETYKGLKNRPTYSRGLNPTVRMFEEMVAGLEGAEDAIGFASGMSAISSSVLSFVEPALIAFASEAFAPVSTNAC